MTARSELLLRPHIADHRPALSCSSPLQHVIVGMHSESSDTATIHPSGMTCSSMHDVAAWRDLTGRAHRGRMQPAMARLGEA